MVDLVHNLIQTEILLESNMLGTLIASYLFLLLVIFVSFLNIYSVDKFEFLNNQQKCLEFKHKLFFVISVCCMILAISGLFLFHSLPIIYVCIALIGFGNSNVFSIVFSQALFAEPEKKNEVSGLMIMGLFGGTVFPLLMGFASDAIGQDGAIAVMAIGVFYLLYYVSKIKR